MISWIKAFVMACDEYQSKRKAQRELEAMSDKELADIGISRSMIRAVVWDYFGRS